MKSSYRRFLNIIAAVDRTSPGKALDELETQLLEYALCALDRGEAILVGDLLKLNQFGSQATLHSRVKSLVSLGYLKLVPDKEDGRKKFVVPTKLTFKYIRFMSECLSSAVRV